MPARSPVERRFFGGWDLPGDLCRQPDVARRAYATGVPMGADLPAPDRRGGPTFVASALADPAVEGHPDDKSSWLNVVHAWWPAGLIAGSVGALA